MMALGLPRQVTPLSHEVKIAFSDNGVVCGRCGALALDGFGFVLFGSGFHGLHPRYVKEHKLEGAA